MIGRLLRFQMQAYARRDSQLVVSQRIADAYACEAVLEEVTRRFHPITMTNIHEALEWQAGALRELDRSLSIVPESVER